MTYQLSTSMTPFNLAFRTKAIILLKLGLPSYGVKFYNEHRNLEDLRANLNLLKEVKENALIQMAMHQR